ncbi:MAG: MFS transporter [Clostridiales bacterium]|nr:MFS transporter [Clostridiales bacterium]
MTDNKNYKITYAAFIWHAFFLALTMSMLDLNTVFPSLVSELTDSKILFGFLYSIMLGVPLIFNLIFSHYLKTYPLKRKFLLLGIYLRSFSFLGMAVFTYFFGLKNPTLAIGSFFFWVFLFSISSGFAGIAYADIMAKTLPSKERTELYAVKQFFSSVAAFMGGLIITKIFSFGNLGFPVNYSISLSIGFIGLFIASLGFFFIKEPPSVKIPEVKESFIEYLKKVPEFLKNDYHFKRYIIVENMASFSIMMLPFYMIFAKEIFKVDNSYIGKYLIFQVTGTIFSNIVWAYLAKKFDSKTIVRTCIFMGGLIPLIAIGLSFLGPNYFAIVFLLLGFIISGRRIGFEPYLLDIAPEEHRTEYLGIRGTLNIFVIILPILGGYFIETLGYYSTMGIVAAVMFLAAFMMKK